MEARFKRSEINESINSDGFSNDEELQKYFQNLGDLPDEVEIDGIEYKMEQYGGSGDNAYAVYTDVNNDDSYIKVFYTLNKTGEDSYEGIKEIKGVSDLRESKKITESSDEEITIPGLTSYKNIANKFKNYRAFAANFEPVIIVKINREYYVYKTTAQDSQDYSYQTNSESNIEGWLYGMVQANNHIFKALGESFKKSKKTESESSLDGKDVTNQFDFIKPFENNFGGVKIIKNSYDKNYYIYNKDETDSKNYLDFSKSKDYIDGWLRGAVKANNGIIKKVSENYSRVQEDNKDVKTVETRIGSHIVEIEVDYSNEKPHIRKIWWNYDNNTSSTGFLYNEDEDKFYAFAYENFLTSKQEQALKDKIKQILQKGVKKEDKTRIPTSKLPDLCYAYNDTTGEIIIIRKGVEGYYPSKIKLDNNLVGKSRKAQAQKLIDEQNKILGVTKDQALQMQLNSMFGWDSTKTESMKLKENSEDDTVKSLDDLKNIIEKDGWTVDTSEQSGKTVWEIRQYTPLGEDWSFIIFFDGTTQDAIDEIKSYAHNFDAEDEQQLYIDMRGRHGIPDDVEALEADGEWKEEQLDNLADKLSELDIDLDESKKITESETNTDIIWENMNEYDEDEIENIRDIIENLDVKGVEVNGHSVKVIDNKSKLEFWIDYSFDGFDITGEWNQYIFDMTNSTDRIKKAVQTSYDKGTGVAIAFDMMESEGFSYLEQKGIITTTEDGGYKFTD